MAITVSLVLISPGAYGNSFQTHGCSLSTPAGIEDLSAKIVSASSSLAYYTKLQRNIDR